MLHILQLLIYTAFNFILYPVYSVLAIQRALDRVDKEPNIQREAAHKRCCERRNKRLLATEEERRRKEEAELLEKRQMELDEEKRVCVC